MNVVKLLTQGLEEVVGATFIVEPDPEKAKASLISHIEKKRAELAWVRANLSLARTDVVHGLQS